MEELAMKGYRILAFGYKELDLKSKEIKFLIYLL
jgi:hypothetical protein